MRMQAWMRWHAGMMALGAALVVLSACRDAGREGPSAEASGGVAAVRGLEREDTLVALAWGGDRLLMPWINMPTMHLMFEPLFGWDRDGTVEGRLVRSWERLAAAHERVQGLENGTRVWISSKGGPAGGTGGEGRGA